MLEKSALMLRVLMNRYHGGPVESILKGLPDELSERVQQLHINSTFIKPALNTPEDAIQQIHYSWFLKKIEKFSPEKQALLLSIIPKSQASKIRKILNSPTPSSSATQSFVISKKMSHFLLNQLYRELDIEEITPVTYLPQTIMTPLASLSKDDLIKLIDYLGLFDLSQEISRIVSKQLLEKLFQSLSQKKCIFLKECLRHKDKLETERLRLEHWDGSPEKLTKLLHHKGLLRLAYALSGQEPDLLWHISHTLDSGRGEKLMRYYSKTEIPAVTESLKKQVIKVLDFLKKQENS